MPKSRVSTEILQTRGSFKAHPERKRARGSEPQATGRGLGEPPACLTPEEKAAWRYLRGLLPKGIASRSDRPSFEEFVRLFILARSRDAKPTERQLLRSYFASYGLSPADRSRVQAAEVEDDPFDKFLAGGSVPPEPASPELVEQVPTPTPTSKVQADFDRFLADGKPKQ